MSIDLNRMPKLGFGLMRLPEKDGEIDLARVCNMVDEYMNKGSTTLILPMCTMGENLK